MHESLTLLRRRDGGLAMHIRAGADVECAGIWLDRVDLLLCAEYEILVNGRMELVRDFRGAVALEGNRVAQVEDAPVYVSKIRWRRQTAERDEVSPHSARSGRVALGARPSLPLPHIMHEIKEDD
ncbi:MAG: hypothetical protein LC749_09105, partial [Actinobacteria bacterium]|nr:hypothetical protein [Actinomycetota bacterium]